MSEGSYRIWKLKENMINHLLLLFFVINLFISLFAADEVNTKPLEISRPFGSYIQPALPKLNIKYNPLPPRLLNFEKGGPTYCPHIEILTRILNELRNFLPQGRDKYKDVLSNYYTILENALNNKYSVEPLNKFSSEDRANYIDSLAQKLTIMDDKNAKIKISFEYELPTIHKTVCEKLCYDLVNYANAKNLLANNDLNYANEQGKIKNNIMTFLQNYRPDNTNPNSSSYIKLKKDSLTMNEPDYLYYPNSDALLSSPVSPNAPILNTLPSISQPLSNQTGTPLYHPLHNFAALHQVPTNAGLNHLQSLAQLVGTSINPLHILAPPQPNPKGNINFLPNTAYTPNPLEIITPPLANPKGNVHPLPKAVHNFNPLEIIAPLPNPKGNINFLPNAAHNYNPLEIIAPPLSHPKGNINYLPNAAYTFNPLEIITTPLPNPKRNVNSLPNAVHTFNPWEIIAPLPNSKANINFLPNAAHTYNPLEFIVPPLPHPKGNINYLPNAAYTFNPLDIIAPPLPNPKGNVNSLPNAAHTLNPIQIIAPPLPDPKGKINSFQKVAHLPQNPIGSQDSYFIENLASQIPKLTENTNIFEKLARPNFNNFDSNKNSIKIYNNKLNAVQPINKNNPTGVTPTTFENRWSQSNYVSTNNQYSNNGKLLQEKLIQSNNQPKPTVPNVELGTNEHNPANLYHNWNTNGLSSIKQYEIEKLEKDSSSAQANSLDKQYLQLVKNLVYVQTNPGTGYFLNPQVPPPSNAYPFSYDKNNVLYNSYMKNINQLATQYNIPNGLAFYPKSYYDNSNLGVTNTAKDTQESYNVQFEDLNRLLGVSNLDKLNFASSKNGIIELTYKLNNSQPSAEPFFYLKYRLPYNLFLFNLKKLLFEKPNLRNDLQLLYKNLLIASNITSSSVLKSMDKDELLKLVSTNSTLVAAKVLNAKDTTAKEQIKIVQRLNANMPLEDIVKTDAHITKFSDLTSNIPLINYLRDRLDYLNDLQRKVAVKPYYLNPYNTQSNQNYYQYVQYPTYLRIRKPTLEYNYLGNQQNYPYFQYGLSPFSRYYESRV